MNRQKIMQITTKNGINYQIGVNSKKEYVNKKEKIKASKKEFVAITDTLELKKNQIISYEYFEMEAKGNE